LCVRKLAEEEEKKRKKKKKRKRRRRKKKKRNNNQTMGRTNPTVLHCKEGGRTNPTVLHCEGRGRTNPTVLQFARGVVQTLQSFNSRGGSYKPYSPSIREGGSYKPDQNRREIGTKTSLNGAWWFLGAIFFLKRAPEGSLSLLGDWFGSALVA